MRFEQSVEIDASQQRVWDVVTDFPAWPTTVDTVEHIEVLTPPPAGIGTQARLKQPKLSEGVWTVTAWTPPSSFDWASRTSGVTTLAGHRIEALGPDRARLVLTLDMRGLLVPIMGRIYGGLVRDYLRRETAGMKRVAEADRG